MRKAARRQAFIATLPTAFYVRLHVPLRQLQYWDTTSGSWATVTGQRPLYIGGNERSTQLVTSDSK